MKNLLLIFVLAFIVMVVSAYNIDWQQTVERLHTECQSDPNTKIQEVFVKENFHGKIDVDQLAIHFRCMSTKMGWQHEDGSANPEELKKFLAKYIKEENRLDAAIKECTKEQDSVNKLAVAIWICASKFERSN